MFNHLVIFAGGLGSRISEESHLVPKPMIELGGLPIIMHIMDYYSKFGVQKFTIGAHFLYVQFVNTSNKCKNS